MKKLGTFITAAVGGALGGLALVKGAEIVADKFCCNEDDCCETTESNTEDVLGDAVANIPDEEVAAAIDPDAAPLNVESDEKFRF